MTTAASAYTEAATATGTWTCPMRLPAIPFERVRHDLTALASDTGWPVAAFCYGGAGEPVTELLLYRDPSRTFGTAGSAECDQAVRVLAAVTGWAVTPEAAPASGVLVGLGLREGYEPTAPRHEPGEVTDWLAAHGDGWAGRTARLVSARLVDSGEGGVVRWYDEVGVVVHAQKRLLSAITELAHQLAQDRFVITDLTAWRTYAFQQR